MGAVCEQANECWDKRHCGNETQSGTDAGTKKKFLWCIRNGCFWRLYLRPRNFSWLSARTPHDGEQFGEARNHLAQSSTESGAESQVSEHVDGGVKTGKEKEHLNADDKNVVVFSVEHKLRDEVRRHGRDDVRNDADYIRDAEKQQHLGDSRFWLAGSALTLSHRPSPLRRFPQLGDADRRADDDDEYGDRSDDEYRSNDGLDDSREFSFFFQIGHRVIGCGILSPLYVEEKERRNVQGEEWAVY